jgi:hypothetical protein
MKVPSRSVLAIVVSATVLTALTASTAHARQGRGNGGGPKSHPVKATSGGTTHVSGPKSSPAPKVHGGGGASNSGKAATASAKPPKTTTAAAGKTTKAATSTTTASAKTKTKTETTTTTGTSPFGSPTGGTTPLTPVQQKLQRNTNLAGKLESRLPKGTDLMLAAEGFRNLGQFVAAVNVSNNLKIPFADLKTSMVDDGLSLGQSIKTLRPLADAPREVSLAESQASVLLKTDGTAVAAKTTSGDKKMKTSGGAR